MTLGYRERIARLGLGNLAPAFFFLNPYTVLTGNIQAFANINRTLGLSLAHKAVFMALSYAHDNAPMIRGAIPQLNQADNLLLLISDNIENRNQIGLDFSFPIQFTSFWNSRYNVNSYWRSDQIRIQNDIITESNPFLSIDISQRFQLLDTWSIEVSGRWNSRTWQGTIYQPQQTFVHFGVQKKFKHSSLGLSWTDIFNTGSFLGFINELPAQNLSYDWTYDLEGSILKVSYTYNFGKGVKQTRNSGANEVLDRVNQ